MKDLTEEEIFRLNFEIWIKGSQVKSVGGGGVEGRRNICHIYQTKERCVYKMLEYSIRKIYKHSLFMVPSR